VSYASPKARVRPPAPVKSATSVPGAGAVCVIYRSFVSNGLVETNRSVFNADNTNSGGSQARAHFGAALY